MIYQIKTHELHRLHRCLKKKLSPKRYHHCLHTAARAAQLARLHGVDWYRAAAAGLLHDICACESHETQLKYLRGYGILLDNFTLGQPQLLHARCGALLLYELGVRDLGVLRAVRCHTTGRAAMSGLEMVVYLADATCEGRDYPGVNELRALADANLASAMRMSLSYTMRMLVERGDPVVSDGWAAYNYYVADTSRKGAINI